MYYFTALRLNTSNFLKLTLFVASDAKDRQHWINLIRAVSEYHTQIVDGLYNSSSQSNIAKEKPSLLKRANTVGTGPQNRSPLLQKSKSVHMNQPHTARSNVSSKSPQHVHVKPVTNPIQDELKNIKDALNSVTEFHSSANEAFEVGDGVLSPDAKVCRFDYIYYHFNYSSQS